jgi:membrane-bound lytic murein transglycosylase D
MARTRFCGLRRVLFVIGTCVIARVSHAQPVAVPVPSERRAVRGGLAPALEPEHESPELRELRRFEDQSFPRQGALPILIRDPEDPRSQAETQALPGRWSGSGDVPEALRSAALPRAVAPDIETGAPAWLRTLKMPEIPVRFDARVVRYLDYFKNDARGHAIIRGWLQRLGRYKALFERVLVREGVPRDLVYLAMIESGFEPAASSYAGAGGIWQFMTGAARAYGLEVSYWVDRRRDPEAAAEAAALYLKDLYIRFGSWPLAFAAYNAGYGAVLQSIARYNTNDYWELIRHESGLPWESTLYVPKILAAAVVGRNLEAFGFADLTMDPPFVFDLVEVPGGTPLSVVAKAAGTTVDNLALLNPALIRGRVPPDRAKHVVRIPHGASPVFAAGFGRAHSESAAHSTVVLRHGETLGDLAKRFGSTEKQLRKLNGVDNVSELRGGTMLVVPTRTQSPAETTDVVATSGSEVGDEPLLVAVPEKVFSYPGRERVFYRVASGDTIESVAGVMHVAVEDIAEWNNLDPAANLQVGMVFQLFVPEAFDGKDVALLDSTRLQVVTLGSEEFLELQAARRGKTRLQYNARQGDTLTKIARRYGLSPGDLARINRYSWTTELKEGDKVIVYSPTTELPREVQARKPTASRSTRTATAAPKPRQRSSK